MFRFAIIALVAVACSGCKGGPPPPPHLPLEEVVGVCDIDSLGMMQADLLQRYRSIETHHLSVERIEAYHFEKLKAFRGEIDGQYRAVASSCRTYMRCMVAHRYDEAACRASQLRWMTSEERFNQLAVKLGELEVDLARAGCCGHKKHHKHKRRRHKRKRHCHKDCGMGPFTECCTD